MTLIIAVIGALIALLGLVGLVNPERFRSLLARMDSQRRFALAIGTRLALGVLLWWLADELQFPHIMRVLAVIAIVAAVGVLLMGRKRLDKLVDWWLSRPDGLIRLSALLAGGFGAFLVWVAS